MRMSKLRWLLAALLASTFLPSGTLAQERSSIAGSVVAEGTQQPLPTVYVAIPALGIGTQTDERGRFLLLQVPQGRHTLRFSLLGFKQQSLEVTVGATAATVAVVLETDPLRLDELVVVGYGTERRANVAGAVSSLRPETVKEVSTTSINEVLQGRLAGVQVSQNSGVPGAAINVRVRGSSSISGGNEPLYVIDGVPLNQGDFSRISSVSFGGQNIDAISDLNPNEIESIEILKDASAAAIYGSRASNGVVLITTRRGMAARPEISFGAYYGEQRLWRRIDLLNAEQYMEIYNEGCRARYGITYDCVTYDDDSWIPSAPGANTNWLDEILRTAPIANMDMSIRGGTDRIRYYVSGTSLAQEGTVRSMGYNRLNGRVNLDYVPLDRLTLGTNISLTRSIYDRARADNTIYSPWSNALANPPVQPVYTEDGGYFETLYANPVGMNNEAEAQERGVRILGNVFATYEILQGVTGRLSLGLDNLTLRSRTWDSPAFGPWSSSGGAAEAASSFVNKITYEGTLNFSRTLAEIHALSGVVGTSVEDNTNEGFRVQGQQFPTEYFKYITSAANVASGTSNRSDWGLVSYFGRLSYTFSDRITSTFNIRRDGSSRFGADNQFGTFPSASLLWRLGDEAFMQGQGIVGNLALRASYGLTGNQQDLGNFASRGLFGGGFNYNDQPGIAPSQMANPNLRWEKTAQLNLGTDFSVLANRLLFTVDYYDKQTEDLLVARPVPRTTGFTSIWDNVGAMQNRGFEVAATARFFVPRSQGAFSWTSTLNVSRNRNKVTALYNDQPFGGTNRVEVGYPLGFFYGYVTDGIFQTMAEIQAHARQVVHTDPRRATAPGDIRFKDINGRDANGNLTGEPDGVINADDRMMIGSPWPDYEGGLTNTMAFRGLDLTAFVQFSQGNDVFNGFRIYADQYGSWGDNHTTRAMGRWRPDDPNRASATEPRAIWGDPNQNTRTSDRFVEDGSYIRLKNIVLGYTLPGDMASRFGFRTARVYVQGQNVLTRTDYSGFDPEVNSTGQTAITRGYDFYTLPQARVFTFGINVGL
jgi:TonB-dependent starch-binding outer membrane protein SusC